jgi:hypothetical protein
MKNTIKNILAIIFSVVALFLLLYQGCERKENVTVTKKQGKETVIETKRTIEVDSIKILKEIIANTKPVIINRWLKPRAKHDTTERQPSYVYSPCDSVYSTLDTGTKEGVKYTIIDTISDNKVKGRSIKFNVPQLTINTKITDSVKSLRVDTVFITKKQKFGTNAKWFLRGFVAGNATGFVAGFFIPR